MRSGISGQAEVQSGGWCRLLLIACCVATGPLTGCASYRAQPLAPIAQLPERLNDHDGAIDGIPTIADLDRLVAARNPDLLAARARRGLGSAQILQATVLPNPQVSASYPFLVSGPGTTNAFSAAIGQDLKSILLLKTKGEVARNASAELNATVLWQEWQTIGKARLLYVDIASSEQAKHLLVQTRKLLTTRYMLTRAAIDQGNATLATLSPDLVAVGDIQKSYDDLERLQLGRRHQLNALLGLAPEAPLKLGRVPNIPMIDPAAIEPARAHVADRRPDLIALQYGYRSEDAKVRQAVLSQFPNLTVGLVGGGDTSNVISVGPQLTIDLPIFDRNQGGIALEEATREQLKSEFNARLVAAISEVGALLSAQRLLARQLKDLEPRLQDARNIAVRTQTAFRQGVFDERAYVDIEVAHLAREQEKVGLQQALLEGQVGLATLLGAGLPVVSIDPEPAIADPIGLFRQATQ